MNESVISENVNVGVRGNLKGAQYVLQFSYKSCINDMEYDAV